MPQPHLALPITMININLLFFVILFSLMSHGMSQCTLKNLSIKQIKMHKYVNNHPVWKVSITNNCYCSQMNVKIACNGFRTSKHVDPSIVKMSRNKIGLVNGGKPIYPYTSFAFTYAWVLPFNFKLHSSQLACS